MHANKYKTTGKKEAAAIKAAAAAANQSLQGYILQAVRARMEQDGQPLELDPEQKNGEEGGTIGVTGEAIAH